MLGGLVMVGKRQTMSIIRVITSILNVIFALAVCIFIILGLLSAIFGPRDPADAEDRYPGPFGMVEERLECATCHVT